MPVVPTVALPLLLLQTPPVVVFESAVVPPTHTVGVPVITPRELIVILKP